MAYRHDFYRAGNRATVRLTDGRTVVRSFPSHDEAVVAVKALGFSEAKREGVLRVRDERTYIEINTDHIVSIGCEPDYHDDLIRSWTVVPDGELDPPSLDGSDTFYGDRIEATKTSQINEGPAEDREPEDRPEKASCSLPEKTPEMGRMILESLCEDSANGMADFMAADALLNKGAIDDGIRFLESSMGKGWEPAAGMLGRLLYVMPRNPEDKARGLELLRKTADEGDPASMAILGNVYLFEEDWEGSDEEGLRLIRGAASQGDDVAMHTLGQMLLDGRKVNKNPEEGARWILRAAETGNILSMKRLSQMYETGDGVDIDENLGIEWMDKASDAGDPEAMFVMGVRRITGDGVDRDVDRGLFLLKESSNGGCEHAHYMLGRYYEEGENVPQSDELSRKYYSRMTDREAYERSIYGEWAKDVEANPDEWEDYLREYEEEHADDGGCDEDQFEDDPSESSDTSRVTIWLMDGSAMIRDFPSREAAVSEVRSMNFFGARNNGIMHIRGTRMTSQINPDNIVSIDIEPPSTDSAFFDWKHIRGGH